jgi:basic amino acid/polyamine antiporter, APA family
MSSSPGLARRLGTGDAVVIGVGSMIGAGVFAAVIAYCNATASAQLAAVYPTSGGTYIYGRERLGAWWGCAG